MSPVAARDEAVVASGGIKTVRVKRDSKRSMDLRKLQEMRERNLDATSVREAQDEDEPNRVCRKKTIKVGNVVVRDDTFQSVAQRVKNQEKEEIAIRRRSNLPVGYEAELLKHAIAEEPKDLGDVETALQSRKRISAIQELLHTERNYVLDLAVIGTRLVVPIRQGNILTMEEAGKLFANIEILSQYMQNLLKNLQEAEDTGELERSIGTIFLQHTENLLGCYTLYCVNYDEATVTLVRLLKKNSDFRKWHDKIMADPLMKNQTLSSFLVKPVQRLCRYPLLLKEIIKNTPESHVDYNNLKIALQEVEKCVRLVNENSVARMNTKMLQKIDASLSSSMKFQVCVTGRRFIKEGRLKKVSETRTGIHIQERHFFLFNDIMLYAEPQGKKYKMKGHFPICDVQVRDMDNSERKLGIEILRQDIGKRYELLAQTQREKREWLEAILNVQMKTREVEEVSTDAAYAIGGKDIKVDQLKLMQVRNRIEHFSSKMGSQFREKCHLEASLKLIISDGKFRNRVVFLFDSVILVTKKKDDAKVIKKSLQIEAKVSVREVRVHLGEPIFDVDSRALEASQSEQQLKTGKGSKKKKKKGSVLAFSSATMMDTDRREMLTSGTESDLLQLVNQEQARRSGGFEQGTISIITFMAKDGCLCFRGETCVAQSLKQEIAQRKEALSVMDMEAEASNKMRFQSIRGDR